MGWLFNQPIFIRLLKIEILHHSVIQSVAKDLGNILYVIEILPPYGRLNDNMIDVFNFDPLSST